MLFFFIVNNFVLGQYLNRPWLVDGNSERRDTAFLRLFLTLTGLTVAVILDTLPYVIATRAVVIVVLIITTTAGACSEVN